MQLLIELLLAGSVGGVKVGIAALGFALIFFTSREMHFAFGALCVLAIVAALILPREITVPAVSPVPAPAE